VTARGLSDRYAAQLVKEMHGPHRIPTMLRRVDQLARAVALAHAPAEGQRA
jgi:deoxyribonuclease V